MKVGIIVHSFSGHTLSVAKKLEEKLALSGHEANLERVSAVDEKPGSKEIRLESAPEIEGYDALIFGCPVNAFSVSGVMRSYLSQLPTLKGKKVEAFVTQSFPFPFMGGNQTIKQIEKLCGDKGASLSARGVVNWSRKERDKKIDEVVEAMSKL